jgi:hypothetical protein
MSVVNKNNIIAFVIAVTVLTVLLMAPEKKGSYYPNDDVHINAVKATTKKLMHEECGKCHFEGGSNPVPDTHVKRQRCYGCHAAQPAEGEEK